MIARTLKLRLNAAQEQKAEEWFWYFTGLWNWTIRKIELDARNGIYRNSYELKTLINGHGARIGVSQESMRCLVKEACSSWDQCFLGARGRPRLKGARNRLASIPFAGYGLKFTDRRWLNLPVFGRVKVCRHSNMPEGRIKVARLSRRARGWYVTLVYDSEARAITQRCHGAAGIDFGFESLYALSTGEKLARPREYEGLERRIGQAQRGNNRCLAARLLQRLQTARRFRNHAISRDLLERFDTLYLSRDNLKSLQAVWGKQVHSAAIGQLCQMLLVKGRSGGRVVVELSNKNSTKRCSSCGGLHGPAGLHGLRVRQWVCEACGASHDRDVNAAMNTLKAGAVLAHESAGDRTSESRRKKSDGLTGCMRLEGDA